MRKYLYAEGIEIVEKEIPKFDHYIIKDSTVKFNNSTWRENYYKNKFPNVEINNICVEYIKGLQWIILYYLKGCRSWSWFFPYSYAPLAQDIIKVTVQPIEFQLSTPYKPFQQLLAVLPSSSANALPECLQTLMTCKESPIYEMVISFI